MQFFHMKGDFDVVGGASALTEAEVIKVCGSFREDCSQIAKLEIKDNIEAMTEH